MRPLASQPPAATDRRCPPCAGLTVALALAAAIVSWTDAAAAADGAAATGNATNPVVLPALLDIATAQSIAVSSHPTLAAAAARVRQAEARFRIVRASFLPTIGIRGSWTEQGLPDALFDSDLPPPDQWRSEYGPAGGAWNSGDLLDSYKNSTLVAAQEAWSDGKLPQFLLNREGESYQSVLSPAELERLLADLQNRDRLNTRDAEKIADALRASYLDATVGGQTTTYRVGAQAQWTVFDGFSRYFRRASARHAQQQSEAAQRDAERLLRGAVAAAYCQAQYTREDAGIAQADVDFSVRMLDDTRRGKEAGTTAQDDVLDFTVRLHAAEAALIEARRKHRLSLNTLAAVMALPDESLPDTITLVPLAAGGLEAEDKPAVLQDEIAFALVHRPDIAASREKVAAQKAQTYVARSSYYPSLWLSGAYDAQSRENWDFAEDDFGWNVSLVASFDLFRGGARIASVDERVAAQAAADAAVAQDELDTIKDVRDAMANLASAREQLALQSRSLEAVSRFRDLVALEYAAGTAPALKLHDAQRKLVGAQRRQASAAVALNAAWHTLQQATARSLAEASPTKKEMNEHP